MDDKEITNIDQQTRGGTPKGVLLIVCFALFFGVLNASAVGVVLPDIADDLSVDTGQLSWLMTGFLLIYGVAIPFYGRLADRYGARPLFLLGVGVFSVGALLSALAPNFEFLLVARIIQAIGGAAVPGLGMTLASRAYGPESRGTVLGVIAATIGLGAAIGPLLGGALSESLGWQSLFFINTAAAVTIPIGLRILPKDEERSGGGLDLFGGAALGLLVGGVLLIPSEGARSGWTSSLVLVGAVMAAIGLVGLLARQRTAGSPFIPREFLHSSRYVALGGMSFFVMATNLAVLIGLPILLTSTHNLSALEVGLTMVPGAIATAVFGVLSGPTHRPGRGTPASLGGVSLDASGGTWSLYQYRVVSVGDCHFHGVTRGGIWISEHSSCSDGIADRPSSDARVCNEHQFDAFFLGGSLGTAMLISVVTSREGAGESLLNPLHSGAGSGFSDAFLLLAIPVLVVMMLSLSLPTPAVVEGAVSVQPEPQATTNWVADCSMPWMPGCEETAAEGPVVAAAGA